VMGGTSTGNALAVTANQLYAVSMGNDRVLTFDRQAGGGILRRDGVAGCVSNLAAPNCTLGHALHFAKSVVASADGQDVYATGDDVDSGITELDRAANGALTPRADVLGCSVLGTRFGCASVVGQRSGEGAATLTLSPDGRFLYAGGGAGTIF